MWDMLIVFFLESGFGRPFGDLEAVSNVVA